jgi:hypothetical protein
MRISLLLPLGSFASPHHVGLSNLERLALWTIPCDEKGHVKLPSLACAKIETVERTIELLSDAEAFRKYLQPRYASGECRPLYVGVEVTVEDYSFIQQTVCVRERGEPDCLWTRSAFIGP